MNDRFDKAFLEVFGASITNPIENAKHCMPNRAAMMPTVGHKTASRSSMYPGATGARTPVTLKSGHESLTAKCRHNGQP
jgi:hypothetical protein